MDPFKLNRRSFLALSGSAVGTAMIGGITPAIARSGNVVVGTWGGDYERLLKQYVAPTAAKRGANFVADVANATARKTKLLIGARRHRSTMDVACLSNTDMDLVAKRDALAEVSEKQIPNLAHVYPQFRKPDSIPHIYSALVIVYNPKLVPKPNSYADLWKSDYAGKIGFSDILYMYMIQAAASAHGGTPDNYDPAKKALMDLKKAVRVYPSNEAVANALHAGEIGVTLMWKARAFQWAKNGLAVDFAVPSEGATPVVFEAGISRYANNAEGAATMLDVMLDPDAQLGFAQAMGYLPTVDNARLPAKLEAELGFTDAQRENFFKPDPDYVISSNSQWLSWWNETFKG